MGMTVIDTLDFPQWNFKLWFLTTLPEGEKYTLTPGTKEAHDYMWSIEGTALELTWNYGTEKDESQKYHPGNGEKDGFGHVAFNTDDVYAASEKLEKAGVTFKKRPDEGRMKGLAFAYDVSNVWSFLCCFLFINLMYSTQTYTYHFPYTARWILVRNMLLLLSNVTTIVLSLISSHCMYL